MNPNIETSKPEQSTQETDPLASEADCCGTTLATSAAPSTCGCR